MNLMLVLLALGQDAFTRLGEGVVDEKGATIYLSGAAGKVEALEAASGRVRWTSEAAGRVIATSGGQVVVEAASGSNLRILLVDVASGALHWTSPAIYLPGWVSTSPRSGRTFAARASMERGVLVYDWEAGAHYVGGIPPSADAERAARRSASGRVSIDPAAKTLSSVALPSEALQALHTPLGATFKVGPRTYMVIEGEEKLKPGAGLWRERRLTCVPSDSAEPGWSHPLRPLQLPELPPSAPGGRR